MHMSTSHGRAPQDGDGSPQPWGSVTPYLCFWTVYLFNYVPGLALLMLFAFLAKFLVRGGNDSYCVLYAILAGVVFRNLFGLPKLFEPGTRTYEVFWKGGIVLLGSQMELRSFREVGLKGLGLAGCEILFVIAAMLVLARIFGIPAPLR
jgi:uncharacterized membrane protein YadS